MMFTGHAITPSSVCKGMDETSQPGLSPEVDYEDVFGGPPRFGALMSLPNLDRIPTANLEKTAARQLSLRTSSHPVFDLPVFGDNGFSSNAYKARSKSDALDDMFDEEGPRSESFSAFALHGVPRSKASSRSSSRWMSPVHPTVALAGQREGDETLVATNLAPNLKCRHSTRPDAGKFFKRGSFSSTFSFDESSGNFVDGSFISSRNDAFISSLPSSPPQSGSFSHMKSIIGTTGSICVGTLTRNAEVDDVFGGFPKRIYPQPLSAVPQESRITTDTIERKAVEKARLRSIKIDSSSSAAHTSEIPDTRKYTISQSCSDSNTNHRDQHEKELMMGRQTDSPVLEKLQTLFGKVSNIDDDHSFLSSSELTTSSPPAVSNTELKFKTWKDLAPDLPANHSHSSSLIVDAVPGATSTAMVTPTMDVPESFAKQQIHRSLLAQDTENLSQTSADLQSGKVDLEERELQTLFANAWRINKRMETENYNAKFPEEAMKVPDVKDQETNWEEQRKHLASQRNSSCTQQGDRVDVDKTEDDINWKEWRKYGRRQRKEQLRDIRLDDSLSRYQATALDRARSLAETSVSFGSAKSQDTEEPFKAEESPSDSLCSSDSQKKFSKGVSGYCGSSEILGNEQALGRFNDVERVASFHGLMSRQPQQSSETLDGRVKCWAAGKEGNLRALLSNLQHVLWSECGWQRIPLTDLIEVSDVKKAYRKATLFVHPDKVQQKGASLQQKYIAGRVFDILQEAWKTFNLEELF